MAIIVFSIDGSEVIIINHLSSIYPEFLKDVPSAVMKSLFCRNKFERQSRQFIQTFRKAKHGVTLNTGKPC
jgi:hypothetical protein